MRRERCGDVSGVNGCIGGSAKALCRCGYRLFGGTMMMKALRLLNPFSGASYFYRMRWMRYNLFFQLHPQIVEFLIFLARVCHAVFFLLFPIWYMECESVV